MLAENLFGFPNWCGFWKWVLWTRLPTFLQSIIEKGTICSPYSWNSWIFTVFCCRLSRLNMAWRTHLAICVMHFQPPGLFKVRKQESIQFGVSSKESKIAAMECSYLCTCVFASSTKLQPWSAHTCAHACACIVNQIAAMESSYLCACAWIVYWIAAMDWGTCASVCVIASPQIVQEFDEQDWVRS